VVKEESRPINGAGQLKTGVQMIDNGILTFTQAEKREFLEIEPKAKAWFRDYIGGDEFINGYKRAILYLRKINPKELRLLPEVTKLVGEVRSYRAKSKRLSTKKWQTHLRLLELMKDWNAIA
jgi:hypothetical protein